MFDITEINKIEGIDTTEVVIGEKSAIIEYKSLNKIKWLKNGFSTRAGGVSQGCFGEMNLSFTVGDNEESVKKNFEIIGKMLKIKPENMVYSHQTHTTNVMRVGREHAGMGILRERNFSDIDGIVTNEKGICLVTSYADCVPLYFVDTLNKAIGLSHSGWRGTVGNICKNTLELMKKEFGTKPENVTACIGPSICVNCYEVSTDVAEKFQNAYCDKQAEDILYDKGNGKYLLNLHKANFYNMVNCGIMPDKISMPDICTCCNGTWLHSHRASGGKRGGLCAFLYIK